MRLQICKNDFCNLGKVKNKVWGKVPGKDILDGNSYTF